MRRTGVLLLVLLIFFGVALVGSLFFPHATDVPIPDNISQEVESPDMTLGAQVELPMLSTQEKINQLFAIPLTITHIDATSAAQFRILSHRQIEDVSRIKPGFVIIFGKKISHNEMSDATRRLHSLQLPLPLVIGVDHEGGTVQRLSGVGFTHLPAWEELCTTSVEQSTELMQTSARELRSAGVDMILAPVIDFHETGSGAMPWRICTESIAELQRSSTQWIDAFSQEQIIPTLKHFPGIGSVTADLHVDYEQIQDNAQEMVLFDQLLERYPTIAVMTSHAGLPEEDIPCSLSAGCLALLDRHTQALIISDDINMMSNIEPGQKPNFDELYDLSKKAILAGNTVVLLGSGVPLDVIEEIMSKLSVEYDQNLELREAIDTSFERLIRWKYEHGV
jgi:beta-N-acetylhexosaminidase